MVNIKHLAIIMDGNRRWAESRGLQTIEGHRAGVNTLAEITEYAAKAGIEYLTVYTLSTENLKERGPREIGGLFHLINESLTERMPELQKQGVRLEFIGDLDFLPLPLGVTIKKAYTVLSGNSRIQLNICLNYGSRAEMVNAANKLVQENVEKIDEEAFKKHLYTKDLPDPDLVIRTGGQRRLSNFLLWQAAYSELFFTPTLWPDFTPKELEAVLKEFAERKRNFGR